MAAEPHYAYINQSTYLDLMDEQSNDSKSSEVWAEINNEYMANRLVFVLGIDIAWHRIVWYRIAAIEQAQQTFESCVTRDFPSGGIITFAINNKTEVKRKKRKRRQGMLGYRPTINNNESPY